MSECCCAKAKSAKIDPLCYEDLEKVANDIKSKVTLKQVPTIGIICGSGLGDLGECLTEKQILPYSQILGFPSAKVIGHKGNLVVGYLNGKYIICLQGRFHPYEHEMNLALCSMPVRVMHLLGVNTLIVSNAAGGTSETCKLGDIMLIKDQIFLPAICGFSPFTGPHDERFGARFISMHGAYDLALRKQAREIAKENNIRICEGVYCMTAGPQYESPAECRFLSMVGADAMGMSTCHEVAVARQHLMRVFGVSLITNIVSLDTDKASEVTHKEVMDIAKEASVRVCKLVTELVKNM